MDVSGACIASLNTVTYFLWSNDVKIMLRGKGIPEFVDRSARLLETEGGVKMHNPNSDMALKTIPMTIQSSCKASVITMTDPKKVWEKLRSIFHTVSESTMDVKLTSLHGMKMENEDTILPSSNKIEAIVI